MDNEWNDELHSDGYPDVIRYDTAFLNKILTSNFPKFAFSKIIWVKKKYRKIMWMRMKKRL